MPPWKVSCHPARWRKKALSTRNGPRICGRCASALESSAVLRTPLSALTVTSTRSSLRRSVYVTIGTRACAITSRLPRRAMCSSDTARASDRSASERERSLRSRRFSTAQSTSAPGRPRPVTLEPKTCSRAFGTTISRSRECVWWRAAASSSDGSQSAENSRIWVVSRTKSSGSSAECVLLWRCAENCAPRRRRRPRSAALAARCADIAEPRAISKMASSLLHLLELKLL